MPRDQVELRATRGGVSLRVRVKPGARRQRLVGPHGGSLKLEVKAAPEKGRANGAVVRLLAETFAVPATAVTIVSGEISRNKLVVIEGMSLDLGLKRLRDAGVAAETQE